MNQLYRFVGVFLAPSDYQNRGALAGKTQRARAADTAAGAGDDGSAPLQSFHAISSCNTCNLRRGDRPASVGDDGGPLDVAAVVAGQESGDRRNLRCLAEAAERHLRSALD